MFDLVRLVGPNQAVEILGVKLVGVNAENLRKLVVSLIFLAVVLGVSRLARRAVTWGLGRREDRLAFWARQAIGIATAILLVVGLVSVWFDDPIRLATALGLVSAGLAFALQRVITALAGYVVILRGRTFNVGDRITMGGVRGDVIRLSFIQTTIMEMGQPASVEERSDPAIWVKSRQYTGRIVTVSNDKVFSEPVYNYTRDFPYVWEELSVPIPYEAPRATAERVLLEAARRHTIELATLGASALAELERRYVVRKSELEPRVYYRLTDSWLELTVRFVARDHAIRDLKDRMSREILAGLEAAGIPIASQSYAITGVPPLRLEPPRETAGKRAA